MSGSRFVRATVTVALLGGLAVGFPDVPANGTAPACEGVTQIGETQNSDGTFTPVVFVHGIMSDASMWSEPSTNGGRSIMARTGEIPGVVTYAFDYGESSLKWVTDPAVGPRLGAALKCVSGAAQRKAVVVAHSMGGLATRQALAADGVRDALAAVVTIGTPNTGSALLGWGMRGVSRLPLGLQAAVRAALAICAAEGVGHPTNPRCSSLAAADSPAGKALQPGSPELAALPPWPQDLPVRPVVGDIRTSLDYFWFSSDTVPLGDFPVLTESAAVASGGEQPYVVSCSTPVHEVLLAVSPCHHLNLTRHPDVGGEVVRRVTVARDANEAAVREEAERVAAERDAAARAAAEEAAGENAERAAIEFFVSQREVCDRHADATHNSRVPASYWGGVKPFLDDHANPSVIDIVDGAGNVLTVFLNEGIITSSSGPDGLLPIEYEFGCPPEVFVGPAHD